MSTRCLAVLLGAVICIYSSVQSAESERIDSLKQVLKTTETESDAVSLYRNLFLAYYRVNYDSALRYAEAAYRKSMEVSDTTRAAKSLLDMGIAFTKKGDYDAAIESYNSALDVFDEQNDLKGVALGNANLGSLYFYLTRFGEAKDHFLEAQNIFLELDDSSAFKGMYGSLAAAYRGLGNLETSITCYRKAIRYHESTGNQDRLADLYLGLARSCQDLGNCSNAQEYHLKWLQFAKKLGNPEDLASAQLHIAENLRLQNDPDSSEYYYQRALANYRELGNLHFTAQCLSGLGRLYRADEEYDRALSYMRESLKANKAIGNKGGQALVMIDFGFIYEQMQLNDSALYAYTKGYELGKLTDGPRILVMALQSLSDLNTKLGNYQLALEQHLAYDSLQSTYFGESNLTKLEQLRADLSERELELTRKDQRAQADQLEIEQAKNDRQQLLIAGIALLLVLSIVSLLWFRERSRSQWKNNLLAERERGLKIMLEATDQVRKSVSRELHDGLGQALTILDMKLHSASASTESPEIVSSKLGEATSILSDAIQETRSIAYRMKPYSLEELGLSATIEEMLRKSIDTSILNYEFESLDLKRLEGNLEFSIYRVCQELVTNTLKHARASELLIQLIQQEGKVLLIQEDNGVGYNYEAAFSTGMGLVNIKNRVDAVGGKITVEKAFPTGQITKVQIPI